jgi:hypothetical protein
VLKLHLLTVLAYVVATFATQATSHFAINADHYASIAHLRKEPIFPLGLASMVIQGSVISYLYSRTSVAERSLTRAVVFAWLMGAVLVSYLALGEVAKENVPAIGSWIAVELGAGFAQFTLFGLLLGVIHGRRSREA